MLSVVLLATRSLIDCSYPLLSAISPLHTTHLSCLDVSGKGSGTDAHGVHVYNESIQFSVCVFIFNVINIITIKYKKEEKA